MKYFLVTPVKNEEKNLPLIIKTIKNQTIKPFIWIIVDDGSTDQTPRILKELKSKNNWIHIINLKKSNEYMGMHYSYVCIRGFNFGLKYCKDNKTKYDYIGLLDGDVILDRDYFENLMKEFQNDPKLGIISGDAYFKLNNKFIRTEVYENIPSGGARLWRRTCFIDTDGFQVTRAPDTVSNTKAELSGWKVKRFLNIKFFPIRKTGTGIGIWWGYKEKGETAYYLNYHPILIMFKSLRISFEKPYYIGIAFLIGYLSGFLLKLPRTNDNKIKNYFWNNQLKSSFNYFFKTNK